VSIVNNPIGSVERTMRTIYHTFHYLVYRIRAIFCGVLLRCLGFDMMPIGI